MANSPQAKKRARQIERRTAVNKNRKSRIRTFLRKVEEAIESGDKVAAVTALRAAQPELMRGVTKASFIEILLHGKFHVWRHGLKQSLNIFYQQGAQIDFCAFLILNI